MKKYYCEYCEFSTDNPQTIKRHLQSIKHKKNHSDPVNVNVKDYESSINICNKCNAEFFNEGVFQNHKKSCGKISKDKRKSNAENSDVVQVVMKQNEMLIKQNEMLVKQMAAQLEENAKQREETSKQREQNQELIKTVTEFARENTGITKKSMSMLQHANTYILNSKPIRKLKKEEAYVLIGYDNPSKEITPEETEKHVKTYVSKYQNNCFVQYVGDMIVTYYKPEKKEDSNILTTDTSRLSFIILQKVDKAINANEKEWVNDKSGKRFTSLVLVPLLNTIKETLSAHVQTAIKKDNKQLSSEAKIDLSNFLTDCNKLKRDLDNEKFIVPILKYVAPSFRFDSFEIESKKDSYKSNKLDDILSTYSNITNDIISDISTFSSEDDMSISSMSIHTEKKLKDKLRKSNKLNKNISKKKKETSKSTSSDSSYDIPKKKVKRKLNK